MGWDSFKKDNKPAPMSDYQATRLKVKNQVGGLLRKIQYNSLLSGGIKPLDAARRLGIRIPFGKRMSTLEVERTVQQGEYKKNRI